MAHGLRAEAAAALEPEPLPWRALRVALSMHRPGAARCAAVRPSVPLCVPSVPLCVPSSATRPIDSHSRFLEHRASHGAARGRECTLVSYGAQGPHPLRVS
jgi:hypothetical protein